MVTNRRNFEERGGDGGSSNWSSLARRRLMIGWKVSLAIATVIQVKIAKKIVVHCVQRQPFRLTMKLPMTGLGNSQQDGELDNNVDSRNTDPRPGPKKGVRIKIAEGRARLTGLKVSLRVPAAIARVGA